MKQETKQITFAELSILMKIAVGYSLAALLFDLFMFITTVANQLRG